MDVVSLKYSGLRTGNRMAVQLKQAADREPGGICSDAFEALTISRIPNPAECAPTAACIPQDKGYGKDSPPLPLTPAHLPPGSLSAIYFTNKGKGGCVSLLASGRPLAA